MSQLFRLPTKAEIKNTPSVFARNYVSNFCLGKIIKAYGFNSQKVKRPFVSCSVFNCINLDIVVYYFKKKVCYAIMKGTQCIFNSKGIRIRGFGVFLSDIH